jgi:predicted acylesterase/phospholipase RssA
VSGAPVPVDLVLSSGFLAFARQVGFLLAVEDAVAARRIQVDGVCGTSSGAMVGALWCAGLPAARIGAELSARPPIRWLRPSPTPWRGAFSLSAARDHLAGLMPGAFRDLPRPFAVGVVRDRAPTLLTGGPLPDAVVASCAMPWVFSPIAIDGGLYSDGGARDRTALAAWRSLRPGRRCVLHLVERSAGPDEGPVPDDVVTVRSPRSGARFWDLGDFGGQAAESRAAASAALAAAFPEPECRSA